MMFTSAIAGASLGAIFYVFSIFYGRHLGFNIIYDDINMSCILVTL